VEGGLLDTLLLVADRHRCHRWLSQEPPVSGRQLSGALVLWCKEFSGALVQRVF